MNYSVWLIKWEARFYVLNNCKLAMENCHQSFFQQISLYYQKQYCIPGKCPLHWLWLVMVLATESVQIMRVTSSAQAYMVVNIQANREREVLSGILASSLLLLLACCYCCAPSLSLTAYPYPRN